MILVIDIRFSNVQAIQLSENSQLAVARLVGWPACELVSVTLCLVVMDGCTSRLADGSPTEGSS